MEVSVGRTSGHSAGVRLSVSKPFSVKGIVTKFDVCVNRLKFNGKVSVDAENSDDRVNLADDAIAWKWRAQGS